MIAAARRVQQLIQRTFDIRQGEFKMALLLQANIFLLISTLLIVKPTVNALFINRFGVERMPWAYVVVAVVAIVGSLIYNRMLAQLALIKIIQRTLASSVAILMIMGFLMSFGFIKGWVIFGFYVWAAIFAVLSASQFWILANVVYNIREAKRMFSFIGSGAIAGGIFGGYLTSAIVPLIGSERMIFIAALFLILCIPINAAIWKRSASKYTIFRNRNRLPDSDDNPISLILKSKHLMFLAAIIGVSVIVARLVDYQFIDMASKSISNPDDLTQFFGFWFSNLNLISLFVQLFITRKVVGVWGVGSSLLLLPLGIFLTTLVFLVAPELWAIVLVKVMDGSLKQSVNKSATELLAIPIPFEVKNRTKSFIDVVVDSIATGIAGFILIFVVNGLELDSRFVSLAIILLVALWIWLAYRVRIEYIKSFKFLAETDKNDVKRSKSIAHPLSVVDSVKRVFSSGTDRQILYMLQQTNGITDVRFVDEIKRLAKEASPEVKAAALQNLYFYPKNYFTPEELMPLIRVSNEKLRIAAFEYMIKCSTKSRVNHLESFLEDHDPRISGAALLSLVTESKSSYTMRLRTTLVERIKKRDEQIALLTDPELIRFEKINMLKILSALGSSYFFKRMQKHFDDSDPVVVVEAIKAGALTMSPFFVRPIAERLKDKQFREVAVDALVSYGAPVVDLLQKLIGSSAPLSDFKRYIPAVYENINSTKSVKALFALLDHPDMSMRLDAIRSLGQLKRNFSMLEIAKRDIIQRIHAESDLYMSTLSAMHAQILADYHAEKLGAAHPENLKKARKRLIALLEQRLDAQLERIFALLELRYPPEDIDRTFSALKSNKKEARVHAVEFLDNLLEGDLKRTLIPIVEVNVLDSVSAQALKELHFNVPTEYECFEQLLQGIDQKVKLAVIALIGSIANEQYIPLLEKSAAAESPKVSAAAQQVLLNLSEAIK